jgi:hypothetical protein
VDGLETDFAMCIVDQGQARRSDAMFTHRERDFAQDLIDKAMALRVAAGAVDLTRKAPCPYFQYDLRGFPRHLSARASHEIHLQSVHRA